MVTALHGNQTFEFGSEKVLETSSGNARLLTPGGPNFRPLGIKYILNVVYLLNFVLP